MNSHQMYEPCAMPNTIILQETASVNTSRCLSSSNLNSATEDMVRLYCEARSQAMEEEEGAEDHVIFDIEEVLDYFSRFHIVQYLERMEMSNPEKQWGTTTMKMYDKQTILNRMVDHFHTISSNIAVDPSSVGQGQPDESSNDAEMELMSNIQNELQNVERSLEELVGGSGGRIEEGSADKSGEGSVEQIYEDGQN